MPNAAFSAPDGRAAIAGGVGDRHFVFGMGANEEGTGDLVMNYLGITSAVALAIVLLDATLQALAPHAVPMLDIPAEPHQRTVPDGATLPAYRYVHCSITMGMAYSYGRAATM